MTLISIRSTPKRLARYVSIKPKILDTLWGTVKISTTNLRFKTMYRWKIDFCGVGKWEQQRPTTGDVDMAPKPEITTSLELWHIASKFHRQIRDFQWWRARKKDLSSDCDNDRLPKIARLVPKTSILPFPVVGRCRNRPGQFLRAGRGRKP